MTIPLVSLRSRTFVLRGLTFAIAALACFGSAASAERVIALSADGRMRALVNTSCVDDCRWIDIDNNPLSIAVAGTATDTFKLHNDGTIWKMNPVSPSWTQIDYNLNTVTIVANSVNLFKLHRDGAIWRWTDTGRNPAWEKVETERQHTDPRRTISIVAAGNSLFQLDYSGTVWRWGLLRCNRTACLWQKLDNTLQATQIAAGVAVDGSYRLYQRHSDGSIWKWGGRPCSGERCPSWTEIDDDAHARTIVAAGTDLYQILDTGRILHWTSAGWGWWRIDDNSRTRAIAAGARDSRATAPLYQVREGGTVWRWPGTRCLGDRGCPAWRQVDNGNAFTQYSSTRGGLYVLDGDGPIIQRW